MARYPGAIWRPITASKGRDPLTVYNRVNLHSTASSASSQHGYFNQSGVADSHFHVAYDGTVEQYVDTSMQAFADLEGNDATVSIETQGVSPSTGDEPWRPAQAAAIISLVAWIMRTHGIRRKLATTSFAGSTSSQGLSWHRLGCNGNFPALPSIQAGRNQRGGGMYYTEHYGKVCPGYDRITQIHQDVWPGVQLLLGAAPTTEGFLMALTNEEQEALKTNVEQTEVVVRRIEAEADTRRVLDLDHMGASADRQRDTLAKLNDLTAKVDALADAIAALTPEA